MLWQTDYTWEPKTEIENAVLPAFDTTLEVDVGPAALTVRKVWVGTWVRPAGALRSVPGPAYDLLASPDPLLKAIGERVKADAEADTRFAEVTFNDAMESAA